MYIQTDANISMTPLCRAEVRSSDTSRIAQTADAVAPDLDILDCDA